MVVLLKPMVLLGSALLAAACGNSVPLSGEQSDKGAETVTIETVNGPRQITKIDLIEAKTVNADQLAEAFAVCEKVVRATKQSADEIFVAEGWEIRPYSDAERVYLSDMEQINKDYATWLSEQGDEHSEYVASIDPLPILATKKTNPALLSFHNANGKFSYCSVVVSSQPDDQFHNDKIIAEAIRKFDPRYSNMDEHPHGAYFNFDGVRIDWDVQNNAFEPALIADSGIGGEESFPPGPMANDYVQFRIYKFEEQ
jgi:hypothetical protein